MRVHWTPLAAFALNDAAEYIAQDNPTAARALVKHVKKSVASLSRFPTQGRPGRVAGTGEFIPGKYPYIIAYRVTKRRIELLDVIHTARLWPESFPSD
ncbi:MAG TPA: type II toxin-antitoxin system RelE/ParE family toxin [Burkholderiales bacterium]|nr:type II toxin-antitoxin system RelE/ParE family toxin [Burkholderiales bacterium]